MAHAASHTRSTAALIAAAAVISAVLTPAAADACWDGYYASSSRVVIAESSNPPPPWKPETAGDLARWLSRLEALLPAGFAMESWDGIVDVCRTGADGAMAHADCLGHVYWNRRSFSSLFRLVARTVRARPLAVRAAMKREAAPLTLQLAAGLDEHGARTVARRINAARPVGHGFYEAGGFPADNDVAHVVTEESPAGTVYRVWVGAYLTRAEAREALSKLSAATGMKGFVRGL